MKTVEYDGESYEVEDWVKYILRSHKTGFIYGYENKPSLRINKYVEINTWTYYGKRMVISKPVNVTFDLKEV